MLKSPNILSSRVLETFYEKKSRVYIKRLFLITTLYVKWE